MTVENIGGSVSPKVLLIHEDPPTLETYSRSLESAGIWVSTAMDPTVALARARELRPNLLVTDIRFGGRPSGLRLARMVKQEARTADVAVVVLTANREALTAETHTYADAILVKPVLPDVLLAEAQALLRRSAALHTHSVVAFQRARSVPRKPAVARPPGRDIVADLSRRPRDCPRCGSSLDWLARVRIGDVEYDYYRWCRKGCGLYCYDRGARDWIKVAG